MKVEGSSRLCRDSGEASRRTAPSKVGTGRPSQAERHIPLSELPELGIPKGGLQAEKKIGFERGVIYSNPVGNPRVRRAYWRRNDANSHCTMDRPAEARRYPSSWGAAITAPKR